MVEHYGTENDGWTDAALQWWLTSKYNEWPENPYRQVTVIGNKAPLAPWLNPEGSALIANLLREGTVVSASISWPVPESPGSFRGGHVLNCWGDDKGENKNPEIFPAHLRVTDCYRNKGGIIQTYTYDEFIKPLQGSDIRKGWYFAYDANQPMIKHIILLSRISTPANGSQSLQSRICLALTNEMQTRADKLSLEYFHSQPVLQCEAQVSLQEKRIVTGKTLKESMQQNAMTFEWDFNRNDLLSGFGFALEVESSGAWDAWNGLRNAYLADKQGKNSMALPDFEYKVEGAPVRPRYQTSNATGGYHVFSLVFSRQDSIGIDTTSSIHAHLLKQYPPFINPEEPVIHIINPTGYVLSAIKAGHSYGYLSSRELEEFTSWSDTIEPVQNLPGDTITYSLNIPDLLPHPEGEKYSKRIPGQ
jgi:hypothetical protein